MKNLLIFSFLPLFMVCVLAACGEVVTDTSNGDSDTPYYNPNADGDSEGGDHDQPLIDGDDPLVDGDDDPTYLDGDISDGDFDANADGDISVDGDDESSEITAPSWFCSSLGFALKKGVNNNFTSSNQNREFILLVPDEMESNRTYPLIFFFHGSGDTMGDFSSSMQISSLVNSPSFPFIAVIPQSLGIYPPTMAFDWTNLQYDSDNPAANLDVILFKDLLGCMREGLNIDNDKIHAAGFSAGAIMTSLVSNAFSNDIASIVSFSGAMFSDQAQIECYLGMCAQWSPFSATNKFPAMIVSGGASDTYNLTILTIDFSQKAAQTTTFLNSKGHDVVSCDHGSGHTITNSVYQAAFRFIQDHPKGTVNSPYATGLPSGFDQCNFHSKN